MNEFEIGSLKITPLVASTFWLDGGAMHGVVPRTLWEKTTELDERHRMPLVARVLLVRDLAAGICALVDVGLGDKWDDKERERYGVGPETITSELFMTGLDADEVTDVVLTHLHWDHAGGVTRRNAEGALELVFDRARHHVSKTHLDDALRVSDKDRGSFLGDDLECLRRSKKLVVHDAFGSWLPGFETLASNGHAEGLAIVRIGDAGAPRVVFAADLIPTAAHVQPSWVMAYDNAPRTSAAEKRTLLDECVRNRDWVVFEHDPNVAAAQVEKSGQRFSPLL